MSEERLKIFVERIDRLEEDRNNIQEAIKETFDEAKMEGYDVPTLKKVIRLRKIRAKDREEQDTLLQHYREILGV